MKKKRALVIGGGGLRGAYDAGVVAELCRQLGPDHFDALYGCSAGSYAVTFFATNQPNVIENVWRNYLDGAKFVHFFNPLYSRHILDLEYLEALFQHGETALHTENLSRSALRLIYVLTNQYTGNPVYTQPTQKNVFDLMNASSVIPFIHPAIFIDGAAYLDGVFSDPLPFLQAKTDGYDDIVVVYNKPRRFFTTSKDKLLVKLFGALIPPVISRMLKSREVRYREVERQLESASQVRVIRPKTQLPLKSILDTNKQRLNTCVDIGIADAKEFLKTYKPT